jgi:HK97 gp10 family phage protein
MTGGSGVTGVPETIKAMREVARFTSAAANSASKHSLEPTFEAARSNAPVRTGRLKRSLVIKRDPESAKSRPRYFVGPRSDSPAARYAHLTEFFSERGRPPLRWMTRAFEATKEEVARRFGELIGPALEKQAARVAAQRARKAGRA